MSQRQEEIQWNGKDIESYLTRHCSMENGVILVHGEDVYAVFTSLEKAMAFVKSRKAPCDLMPIMMDDPDYTESPSILLH